MPFPLSSLFSCCNPKAAENPSRVASSSIVSMQPRVTDASIPSVTSDQSIKPILYLFDDTLLAKIPSEFWQADMIEHCVWSLVNKSFTAILRAPSAQIIVISDSIKIAEHLNTLLNNNDVPPIKTINKTKLQGMQLE